MKTSNIKKQLGKIEDEVKEDHEKTRGRYILGKCKRNRTGNNKEEKGRKRSMK